MIDAIRNHSTHTSKGAAALVRRLPVLVLVASGLAACNGDHDSPAEIGVELFEQQIEIQSGDHQVGAPGTELPFPLVVRLFDNDGNPLANTEISWKVTLGGGQIISSDAPCECETVTTTDSEGRSGVRIRLGWEFGHHELSARTVSSRRVVFVSIGA